MRFGWQAYADRIARGNDPARNHDRHHARLAHQGTVRCTIQHRGRQARPETVQLRTRIAQTRHPDDGLWPKLQFRPGWQRQKIDSARRDVLADVTGVYGKTFFRQFAEQLDRNEMDLAQIQMVRMFRRVRTMFDGHTTMRIPFDAKPGEQTDVSNLLFGEGVVSIDADGNDGGFHDGMVAQFRTTGDPSGRLRRDFRGDGARAPPQFTRPAPIP